MTVLVTSPATDFSRWAEMKFFDFLGTNYPGSKVQTANAKFNPPANAPYFRFYVIPGETFNVNVGRARWERTPVVLHIAVYAPVETAERAYYEMAEAAGRAFCNQDFKVGPSHDVKMFASSIVGGPDPKSNKYRVIAKVRGWHDARTAQ